MTSDVAGVLCQDLNPPANVRSAVSLDEYCPVISQRITERYPTEKCSELRPEPSIAAAVLAVTGPAGVPIADDADVGIRIRAFESVYALLATVTPPAPRSLLPMPLTTALAFAPPLRFLCDTSDTCPRSLSATHLQHARDASAMALRTRLQLLSD